MVNTLLHETHAIVTGLAPIAPSSSTPDYVSLKGVIHFTAVIVCDNGTTVTGSAITLKQAVTVAAGSEKALEFDVMWANEDTAAADTLTETAVTSDTFTADTTNAKNLIYIIEVDPATLDKANDFDCIRVGTANSVSQVLSVTYFLELKHKRALPLTSILD